MDLFIRLGITKFRNQKKKKKKGSGVIKIYIMHGRKCWKKHNNFFFVHFPLNYM